MTVAAFDPSYGQNASGQYDYNPDSADPSMATDYYSTLQQAQAAAAAKDPQYASQITAAGGTGDPNSTITGGAGGGGSFTGLPTSSQLAADAPLPLQSFGATPTVTPTYANAALVNPNNTPQYLAQEEQANYASDQPLFQQQQQQNQDQLAARGISSSGAAADLTNQLYGQQAAVLAGQNAPAIQQQSGYQQQDITNNQANRQAINLFNAGEGTAASGTNAQYYDQALTGNATTYNNYLTNLENQGYNTSNEAYTAYLNSFGPNSGVTSGYNGAVGAIGNSATGAYDSTIAGQGAALGALGQGVGTAASGGAFK